jgi:hypothetical protein
MARIRNECTDASEKSPSKNTDGGIKKKAPTKATAKRAKDKAPTPPPTKKSQTCDATIKKSSPAGEKKQKTHKPKMKLKDSFHPLSKDISSDDLVPTAVTSKKLPRNYWIQNYKHLSAPWIASSHFVPPVMVEFLMRSKKKMAIGVKWQKGDKITNMEGAMHTFVTSIVLAWSHGDISWQGGHTFTSYPPSDGFRTGRQVLVSGMIHQDFETTEVLMKLASLTADKTTLVDDFNVPSVEEKQSDSVREEYDDALRRLMVHHLTKDGELPSIEEGSASAMTRKQVKSYLADKVINTTCKNVLQEVSNKLFWLNVKTKSKSVPLLSLEVLVATAFHMFRNEMGALETICPQGYTYTFSPPSIFVGEFGKEDGLMSHIYAAGLKHYLQTKKPKNMRVFSVADVPGDWLACMRAVFSSHLAVPVVTKEELYSKEGSADSYSPPSPGTMLVMHNCSDAFGQNIQYEGGAGSRDALVGRFTSAAGSLLNNRGDLVKMVAVFAE